jgi:cytochrome P450
MTETLDSPDSAEIPAFPLNRPCPYQIPQPYYQLRDEGPALRVVALPTGQRAWVVTSYDAARRLLTDRRLSSDREREGFPSSGRARTEGRRGEPPTMIAMDPPEHDRLRAMVISRFAVRRVHQMRGAIERFVHETLDTMIAGGPPADFVAQFALQVPSLAICELLGVPYADHEFFQDKAARLLEGGSDPALIRQARVDLDKYFDQLIDKVQQEPNDGVISELVANQLASGEISRQDVISMGGLLLSAGHDTTASMASLSVITLLHHRDQYAALQADRSLIPGAVEELLRYLSIADTVTARVAIDDIELDGHLIRAGEAVIVSNAIVNRDPAVFTDPDRLDLARADRRHMAFGFGIHQCLGQNLARLELEVILAAIVDRLPYLALAVPFEELVFRPFTGISGVKALPVTW